MVDDFLVVPHGGKLYFDFFDFQNAKKNVAVADDQSDC